MLAYPSGQLASRAERSAVGLAYIGGVFVLGILPALVFDPHAQGCTACPSNLLAVSDRSGLWTDLNETGLYLALAWALALGALAIWKSVRASAWSKLRADETVLTRVIVVDDEVAERSGPGATPVSAR